MTRATWSYKHLGSGGGPLFFSCLYLFSISLNGILLNADKRAMVDSRMVVRLALMALHSAQGDAKSEMAKSSVVMNAVRKTLGCGRRTRVVRAVTESVSFVVMLVLKSQGGWKEESMYQEGHLDSDKRQRVECSKEVGVACIKALRLDYQALCCSFQALK